MIHCGNEEGHAEISGIVPIFFMDNREKRRTDCVKCYNVGEENMQDDRCAHRIEKHLKPCTQNSGPAGAGFPAHKAGNQTIAVDRTVAGDFKDPGGLVAQGMAGQGCQQTALA